MNGNVAIRGYDVDLPGLEHTARVHDFDRQGGAPLKNSIEAAGPAGVKVLSQYDGRGEVFGQSSYEDRERLDTARGRTDNDQVTGSVGCILNLAHRRLSLFSASTLV